MADELVLEIFPGISLFGEAFEREGDGGGGVLPHVGASARIESMLEAQGLPSDYLDDAPFTVQGKRQAIGNGVPLPMGRAIARAVKLAIAGDTLRA